MDIHARANVNMDIQAQLRVQLIARHLEDQHPGLPSGVARSTAAYMLVCQDLCGGAEGVLCGGAGEDGHLTRAEQLMLNNAYDAAVKDDDWSECLRILSRRFALHSPSTSADNVLYNLETVRTERASLPWIDPRFHTDWDDLSVSEQWQELAGFVSYVTDTIHHHVLKWSDEPRAHTGIKMALMRSGHVKEASALSAADMHGSLIDLLMAAFMSNGTIDFDEHANGEPWCYLVEILQHGLGAIFHALSNPRFLDAIVKDIVRSLAAEVL